MIRTLSRNIVFGKTYCSIEHLGALGQEQISFLIAKTKKGELEVEDQGFVNDISELPRHLSTAQHAHLIINNSQVLFKKALKRNATKAALVHDVFPSINISQFYFEVLENDGDAFAFICRKTYVDELIHKYAELKIYITSWSIGVSSIQPLLPLLYPETTEVHTPSHVLSLAKDSVKDIRKNELYAPSIYTVEGIDVSGEDILKLGGVANSFGGLHLPTSNFEDEQHEQKQNFKQHRYYALGLPLALGILLLIFLVNFLVYNHYYTKTSLLSDVTELSKAKKELLKVKDSIVSQKQKLFEDVIKSASSSASLFVDDIIDTMPDTILLSELAYQPLERKVRAKKALFIDTNTISIQGQTRESESLSYWISELEDLNFIKKASITNLTSKGSLNTFTLELIIKGL